jgi:hypothetical protein
VKCPDGYRVELERNKTHGYGNFGIQNYRKRGGFKDDISQRDGSGAT